MLAYDFHFLIGIEGIPVEADNDGLSKLLHIAHVSVQILKSYGESFGIWLAYVSLWYASVHLKSLRSGDDDCQFRLQSALAAFDVEELFCSEVCTKASLCDDIFTIGHCCTRGNDGVASMCNVGERSSVNECRSVFCCLYEVGIDGITQQYAYTSSYSHVLYSKWSAVGFYSEQYVFYSPSQVFLVL